MNTKEDTRQEKKQLDLPNKKNIISVWITIYSLNLIAYFLTAEKTSSILHVLFLQNVFYATVMTFIGFQAYMILKSAGNIRQSLAGFVKTREDNPEKLTTASVIKVSIVFFVAAFFALSFISYITMKSLL